MSIPVCIVMATFNGEAFLEEQIESIRGQTERNWRLIIRDDGSQDDTLELLQGFASVDSRISILDVAPEENLGPSANFNQLLQAALSTDSEFFFLSDQDDRWEPTKISRLLNLFPPGRGNSPYLAYSGYELVDSESKKLASQANGAKIVLDLRYLLSLNAIPGCCIAINRGMLQAALPIPAEVIMHDWWLVLVAAACGGLLQEQEKLVQYRQHENNTIGAFSVVKLLVRPSLFVSTLSAGRSQLQQCFTQANGVLVRLTEGKQADAAALEDLRQFCEIPSLSSYERWRRARALSLRKDHWLLRMILYFRLATMKKPSSSAGSSV